MTPGPLRDALASPASLTAAAIVSATPQRKLGRCGDDGRRGQAVRRRQSIPQGSGESTQPSPLPVEDTHSRRPMPPYFHVESYLNAKAGRLHRATRLAGEGGEIARSLAPAAERLLSRS